METKKERKEKDKKTLMLGFMRPVKNKHDLETTTPREILQKKKKKKA